MTTETKKMTRREEAGKMAQLSTNDHKITVDFDIGSYPYYTVKVAVPASKSLRLKTQYHKIHRKGLSWSEQPEMFIVTTKMSTT